MSEVWVLQIQNVGWRNIDEGTEAEMQKSYVKHKFSCTSPNTTDFRIREKNRKPRKNCRDCKGTGQHGYTDGRGESCMVWCECLND